MPRTPHRGAAAAARSALRRALLAVAAGLVALPLLAQETPTATGAGEAAQAGAGGGEGTATTEPAAGDGSPAADAPAATPEADGTGGADGAAPAAPDDGADARQLPPGTRRAIEQLEPATVERAITVLENETERQRLLDTLRAIAAAEEEAPPAASPTSVVAQPLDWLEDEIDQRLEAVRQSLDAVLQSGGRVALFFDWLARQASEPQRRAFWFQTLGQIGGTLGLALAIGLVVRRFLRGPREGFEVYAPPTPLHFAGAIVLQALLRLVPIAVFVATAGVIALVLDLGAYTAAVTRSLVEGLAFVTAITAVLRAVLNVRNPHMRLFPVEEDIGGSIQRGVVRVLAVGGYGYFGLQAARALGLPWTLHGFLEHVLFFVTFLLYVRLVLRFRRLGADGLHALSEARHAGIVGRFLPWQAVARSWHVVAILLGLAIYGAWALEIAGGPAFLFRALGITIVVLFVARLINVWLTARAVDRAPGRPSGEEEEEAELGDAIVTAARSPLSFVLRLATIGLALVLILQAWGVDVWGWLRSDAGEALRDAALSALVTLGVAYLIWQVVSRLIRGAIDETDNLGRPLRSSRSQTLLTIGRNFAFVVIWVTGGMLALSELGVNLAPLIAGAGVIGLAVGFGSQQLVQDIITGFFILLEDTIAVGDVADLGGKVGVVEAVTLRIVRLRGYDGQVHTIPYSKISTISNLTKDYSYYVFDVGVAYKENVDRVMAVMAEVGAQMQRERAYRRLIVEPLEIAGVDRFAESAVIIRARMKTRPLQQWTVGREYNRRLKNRFDELGIEIPFPQRTLHVATPAATAAFPTPAMAVTGAPDGEASNVADGR